MKKIILLSLTAFALAGTTQLQAQIQNTQFGVQALNSIAPGGNFNSAFGYRSMFLTTTGDYNVGVGHSSLYSNVNGGTNIGIGYAALYSNTNGNANIAIGAKALATNTTGTGSIAIGQSALGSSTGSYNLGVGHQALQANTTGQQNIALGYNTLSSNTIGVHNIASGTDAMRNNTSGHYNVASGSLSLFNNTSGRYNVAMGYFSAYTNTTGIFNVALGVRTLSNNSTGTRNVGLGVGAGPNAGNYTNTAALGSFSVTTASNQVRVGNTAVTSIGGYAAWTNLSDGRFKKNIKENVVGLEFINKLRPVSYTVDNDKLDKFLGTDQSEFYKRSTAEPYYQTGFIAQEVEATAEKAGFTTFNGVDKPKNDKDHYGIRYAEFVVPLVKAVQELSSNNDELKQNQTKLLSKIEEQQKQIEALLNANTKSAKTSVKETLNNRGFELYQNNPNPFSVATEIKMVLPETVNAAQIIVYDMEGKQLKTFNVRGTGKTSVNIEANALNAGMYIYALIADGEVVSTKQMIITK